MIWTDEHNELLMREVLLVEPYQFKVSTKERGNASNGIAEDHNNIRSPRFHVNKRSVREHYGLLLTNYKRKMAEINKASGINVIETPLESLIKEILERAKKEYEEMFEKEHEEESEKLEAERLNAEEMRLKAMENLRETKKRSKEKTGNETETMPKRRASGAEGMAFLRDRADQEMEMRVEVRKKEQESFEKAQLEQQKLQQESMKEVQQQQLAMMQMCQQMQQQMLQQQQQTQQQQTQFNQLLLALFSKISNN